MEIELENTNLITPEVVFNSKDGMISNIWGPCMWLFLHSISFNYPLEPTNEDKQRYKDFVYSLRYILPCRHCRENLTSNLIKKPITDNDMKNRENFSRYMYELHNYVNTMLGKKFNQSYEQVRFCYENFRARCSSSVQPVLNKTRKHKEKGCVKSLIGVKKRSIIKIVPYNNTEKTFQVNKKCFDNSVKILQKQKSSNKTRKLTKSAKIR